MSFENIENGKSVSARQNADEAGSKLLDDSYPKRPTWPYIDQESTKIADMLNNAGRYANGGPDSVKPAAEELSSALKGLKDPTDYNDLIFMTAYKTGEYAQKPNVEHQFSGHISVKDWNSNTGTWDNVTLSGRGYPMTAPIHIAQPGNTLWKFSVDRLNDLKYCSEIDGFSSTDVQKMIRETASKNGIADPAKISVGDAITMPHQL